jgi:hypothetical protein
MMVLPTAPALGFRLKAGVTVYTAEAEWKNVTEAEFVLVSDAVTMWAPACTSGTVNAQKLKLPTALAVQDMETVLPSTLTVMGAFGAKPLPLTAAPLSTGPAFGVKLMPGLMV